MTKRGKREEGREGKTSEKRQNMKHHLYQRRTPADREVHHGVWLVEVIDHVGHHRGESSIGW
jgi:hypothetical protein